MIRLLGKKKKRFWEKNLGFFSRSRALIFFGLGGVRLKIEGKFFSLGCSRFLFLCRLIRLIARRKLVHRRFNSSIADSSFLCCPYSLSFIADWNFSASACVLFSASSSVGFLHHRSEFLSKADRPLKNAGFLLSFLLIFTGLEFLKGFAGLSRLKRLKLWTLIDCPKLTAIQGLGLMESLEQLEIKECPKIESLDDLSDLKKLESLFIRGCDELRAVKGLDELETLKRLDFRFCRSTENFTNISNSKIPDECCIRIYDCFKLEGDNLLYLHRGISYKQWKVLEMSNSVRTQSSQNNLRIHSADNRKREKGKLKRKLLDYLGDD